MPAVTSRFVLALSLSLGVLAACTPAPFQPGTTVSQPQPAAPRVAIQGGTLFKGEPVADATIELEDYFTGRPLPTFSAGTTTPAGVASVERESLKTDAEGRFTVKVAGLDEKTVLYLAVKKEGVLLANVYTRSPRASGYRTMQADMTAQEKYDALVAAGIFSGFPDDGAKLDTLTSRSTVATLLSKLATDQFPQDSGSSASFRDVPTNMLYGFADTYNQFGTQEQPSLPKMEELLTAMLMKNLPMNDFAQNLPSDPNVSDWAKDYVAAAVQAGLINTMNDDDFARNNRTLLTGLENLSNLGFQDVVQVNGNTIRIGDQTFDATAPVVPTGDSPSPTPAPSSTPPPVQAGVETIETSSDFTPTVVLSNVSNVSKVSFTQPEGSEDVETVYTRFKKSDLKAENGVGAYGDITWGNFAASGILTGGNFSGNLAVPSDSSEQAPAVTLPSRFGYLELTSADGLYSAPLTLNGNVKVARFSIYQRGDYVYLVIKYLLTDSVRINSGHTTKLDTTTVWLTPGTSAESVLISRRGHRFEGFQKVE